MTKRRAPEKSKPKASTKASAKLAAKPFRFRDLPIELRTRIYKQVFSGAVVGFDTQSKFMASETSIHRNLLMASKDCYREGIVFYPRSIKTLVLGNYDLGKAHGMILEYLPHASEIRLLKDTTLSSAAMIPTVMPKLNKIKMPKFEFEAMGRYGDIDVECWWEQLEWTEFLQGCLPEVTKDTLPAIEVTGDVRFETSCDTCEHCGDREGTYDVTSSTCHSRSSRATITSGSALAPSNTLSDRALSVHMRP